MAQCGRVEMMRVQSVVVFLTLTSFTVAANFGDVLLGKIILLVENFPAKTCGRPVINNVMKNLTLQPGDKASFRCTVDMKCLVSYIQWYHEMNNGSSRLLKTAASTGDPYSYLIPRVGGLDEGFYTCIAGNIMGETVSSAYLEISAGFITPSPCWTHLLIFTLILQFINKIWQNWQIGHIGNRTRMDSDVTVWRLIAVL